MRLPFTASNTWAAKSNIPTLSVLLSHIIQQARPSSSSQSEKNGSLDQKGNKIWKRVSKRDPVMLNIVKSQEMQGRISELAKVMDCNESKVTELVKRNSSLAASKTVVEKIKLLKNNGFSSDEIISNPAVLHRSLSVLRNRLGLVNALALPSITLHAIRQPDKTFDHYIQRRKEDSEVLKDFASHSSFLAHIFACDEKDIGDLKADNKFLRSVSPTLIKRKVEVLKKHNIPSELLRKFMRILVHVSSVELDRRLSLLKQQNLLSHPDLKLGYLLSCGYQDFSKSLDYLIAKRTALEGCQDKVEYLCVRLHCNELSARLFFDSNPVSEIKLKERLDFLLKELKLDPSFVLKYKELLTFSVKRLRSRWTVLSDTGYSISTLPGAATLTEQKFAQKFGSSIYVDTFKSEE